MMKTLYSPFILNQIHSSDKMFIRSCISVILKLLNLYGFDVGSYKSKNTEQHWFTMFQLSGVDVVKFVKWKLNSYYSFHKKQILPPAPGNVYNLALGSNVDNPAVILGGRVYKFLNMKRRTDTDWFESWLVSMLNIKKGMPRPTKVLINIAEQDAFLKLTKASQMVTPVLLRDFDHVTKHQDNNVDYDVNEFSMKKQIFRTVFEVLGDAKYTDEERFEPFFPSTSANYINSRGRAGAVGFLFENGYLTGKRPDSTIKITTQKVHKQQNLTTIDTNILRMEWELLYRTMMTDAIHEAPVAVPLGLAEALKVRVITKGPPLLNTVLKPLQRFMWGQLQKFQIFKLTGQTITAEYIQDVLGKSLKEDESFLSVDYSDATNEIISYASDCVAEAISIKLNLTKDEAILLKTSLTGHILEYEAVNPNYDEFDPDSTPTITLRKPQTNGQLMGSISSFYVLCLINATVCRWAKEITTDKSCSLKNLQIPINGDDAVMKTTLQGKQDWEDVANAFGLKPSVGKVYYSKEFLNMNSTTYTFYPDGWEGYQIKRNLDKPINRIRHFRLIPYVNMGLLMGLTRSAGQATVVGTNYGSIGARSHDLIENSPPGIRERVMCQFLHENKESLQKTRCPWFIPENLGGLGLKIIGKYTPHDFDLRLARRGYENQFPLPLRPVNTPWTIWKFAQDEFKKLNLEKTSYAMDYVHFSRPTGDMSISESSSRSRTSNYFNIAEERVGYEIYSYGTDESRGCSNKRLMSLLCIDALFTAKIKDLFDNGYQKKMLLGLSGMDKKNAIEYENIDQTALPGEISDYVVQKRFLRQLGQRWKKIMVSKIPLPEPFNVNRFPTIYSPNDLQYMIEKYKYNTILDRIPNDIRELIFTKYLFRKDRL